MGEGQPSTSRLSITPVGHQSRAEDSQQAMTKKTKKKTKKKKNKKKNKQQQQQQQQQHVILSTLDLTN